VALLALASNLGVLARRAQW